MEDLLEKVREIEGRFSAQKGRIATEHELMELKASFVGKKGDLTGLIRALGTVPPEHRPEVGQAINQVKQRIEGECHRLLSDIRESAHHKKVTEESYDVTLPGRTLIPGALHPVTQVMEEVQDIFVRMGFEIHEGPEMETEYYNFDALNMPAEHPARDEHDTFYIQGRHLLRTHTSPVQIHVMKGRPPPIRMIGPGAVYRRDLDVSHTPVFHQVEGLAVDRDIRFSDLKGVLHSFINSFFGKKVGVRFRPSFFPFTEPSAEMDLACFFCRQKGCQICKRTGWIEVMGCGMVDPHVFEMVDYDPKKFTGLAFGMGIERMAMLKFGVNDIRLFFENDLRFLEQF